MAQIESIIYILKGLAWVEKEKNVKCLITTLNFT
jgi:hypothetical protein